MKKESRMHKILAILVVLTLIISIFAGCGSNAKSDAPSSQTGTGSELSEDTGDNTVKIAAFYNMSGISGDAGALSKKGWELAVKQINESGGIKSLDGAKIEIVIGDTLSDSTQAKAVAERILADDSIVAAIGVGASAQGLPMLPVFEKLNVGFTHNGIGDSFTTQGYTAQFQHVSQGSAWGVAQVNFLKWLNEEKGLDIKKVALCYENTENGISNADGAKKTIAEVGGLDIVYDETFTAGLSDAAPLVTKMKQSGAEIIFLNGFTQDVKLITNAMKSMSYDPIIFGAGAAVSFPVFADEMGEDVDGILLLGGIPSDTPIVNDDPMTAEAAELFEELNDGEFFGETAAGAYIGVRIIAQALEDCGSRDRETVKNAMRNVTILSYEGGPIAFDETGKNQNAIPFVSQWQKREDGTYRPYCVWPVEYASKEIETQK